MEAVAYVDVSGKQRYPWEGNAAPDAADEPWRKLRLWALVEA